MPSSFHTLPPIAGMPRSCLCLALAAIPVTDIAGVLRFAAEIAVNEMKDARGAAEAVRHLQSMPEPT